MRYEGKKRFLIFLCAAALSLFSFSASAQEKDLEYTIDANANAVPLPKLFRPMIDLSGRGLHDAESWPKTVAAEEAVNRWQRDVGFSWIYRMQYSLWDLYHNSNSKELQSELLHNYEKILKRVTDAGGVVIVNLFGIPPGTGKVLNKKSPPFDLRGYKALIKNDIRYLSCIKKYSVWYEVWNAPDLDDFFLGRRQEYLAMYRAVAESVKELEQETKIHIPVGGPAVSWWFRGPEQNTILTPERGLIYDLIKYCARYRLPLDFVSWHAYSTDPKAEQEMTIYNKTSVSLIREWLSYFNLNKDIPLIVDEWNYDSGTNVAEERLERSHVCASYIVSRLRHMHDAGIDYQLFFSLEDFQNNKENVVMNTGIFWFDPSQQDYKGGPKPFYAAFRMLSLLEKSYLASHKLNDDYAGIIATKDNGRVAVILYNYTNPFVARDYINRHIATLRDAERKEIINLAKKGELDNILRNEIDLSGLRIRKKTKAFLKNALELREKAKKFQEAARTVHLNFKNLKGDYLLSTYLIDGSTDFSAQFEPVSQKGIFFDGSARKETFTLPPYSVTLIVLRPKPQEPKNFPSVDEVIFSHQAVELPLAGNSKPAEQLKTQEAVPQKTEETQAEAE